MPLRRLWSTLQAKREFCRRIAKRGLLSRCIIKRWSLDHRKKWFFITQPGLIFRIGSLGRMGPRATLCVLAKNSFSSPLWDLTHIEMITSQEGRAIILKPTNILQGSLVQLHGAKTGFTDIAGGNLLVLLEQPIGRPVGIVVLGSTHKGRFSDMAFLLALLRQNTIR